jgi:peptide/nickel transport system substrate-binding protein
MTTDEIVTGMSETGYSNPVYDDLFAQQAVALDPAQRKEIIWEMQRIVHEDVVYIIPYYASNVQAFRNDGFQGWITDAGKVELSDLSSLHVIEPVQ